MATAPGSNRRTRAPPLQTSFSQRDRHPATPSQHNTPEKAETPRKDHQRFVLTDPVAFQYLESDKSTQVLARHQELQGYECYVVEQWATSRTHPTFVISTYTGDPTHAVFADVLSVPSDESTWSPRLRVYFKALNQYHARREMTPLGTLMVTNLSSFPSTLTVIPIPGGDVRRYKTEFLVNEDLKRLGCSGRIGLTLSSPTANTVAKFHQLYQVSDKNQVPDSVVELVKLCQLALTLFDKLESDYTDGLLCDVTEHAISKWWNDIGAEHYEVEPHDGVLGPTTVAALLGLLMGARNRLHSSGAPVPKDPFDTAAMKRGISSFQKQQRLPRTRRLDRATVQHLVQATAKAASHEGWTVPRAVKSTVAELSGRGGEMISDIVGRRDRAGIAEIETTDYDRFVQLVSGERPRWLWQGKAMKKGRSPEEMRFGGGMMSFNHDQQGGFAWKKSNTERGGTDLSQIDEPRTPGDTDGSEDEARRSGLRKRATDLKNDAKSGFDKIKGAVQLKSSQQRMKEKDDTTTSPLQHVERQDSDSSAGSPFSHPGSPFATHDQMPTFSLGASPESQVGNENDHNGTSSPRGSSTKLKQNVKEEDKQNNAESDPQDNLPTLNIEGSIYEGVDLKQTLPEGAETQHDIGRLLRRTISDSHYISNRYDTHQTAFYPKHLSFSLAEDSVLPWDNLNTSGAQSGDSTNQENYAEQALEAEEKKLHRQAINQTRAEAVEWTQQQLYVLRGLVQQSAQDEEVVASAYQTRQEQMQALKDNTNMLLEGERDHLNEGNKELETLTARLNYEIDGLRDRIEDVENIVEDFEKGVLRVEERVLELEHDGDGARAWRCIVS